jgi:integrase
MIPFRSPLAADLRSFLSWKRRLGCVYARAEFTLASFDRFYVQVLRTRADCRLDQVMLAWLARPSARQPISVSADVTVIRQLWCFLRRHSRHRALPEPIWPVLPTTSTFTPYILSGGDIRRLLCLAGRLERPRFRAALYRALILLLYGAGLRFGEALRLRMRDVDTHAAVICVDVFKGRARWVPFHRSLANELEQYLTTRRAFAPAGPDDRFFVGTNRKTLPVNTASETLRRLFRAAELKPARGRSGPRPYDLRHAFAVHRLARWYRQGVDLHAHLPWLSAYMGHVDILGTETYLTATPALLGLAGRRFHRLYRRPSGRRDVR